MEDKLTIRIPQIWKPNEPNANYVDKQLIDDLLGYALGGASALTYNLTQFMVGAPVVDYSSIRDISGTGTGFSILCIDTSRPFTTTTGNADFDASTPYSVFSDGLMQNRSAAQRSAATGTYTIVATTSNYTVTHAAGGGGSLELATDAANTTFTASYGAPVDFFDSAGNYCVTLTITGAATGNRELQFDVVNPTYTDALNWGDMHLDSTRHQSNPTTIAAWNSHLYFDAGRIQGNDPSDPVSLYDMQGIMLAPIQQYCRVAPVARFHKESTNATMGFVYPHFYSTSTNSILTTFSAGAATGGTAHSPVDRGADYFTILRGHGYVRMYGQVADPNTGVPYTTATHSDKDVSYFFGMFRPYEDVTDYKNPMAFLGDVGFAQRSTDSVPARPWWRTSRNTLAPGVSTTVSTPTPDSNIWTENVWNSGATGYWFLACPFILSRDFELNAGTTLNTPNEVKAFPPYFGNYTGVFWNYTPPDGDETLRTTRISIGSKDDSVKFITTPFSGSVEGTAWDHVIGTYGGEYADALYGESPSAPRILPVTLRQMSPDDHGWTENYSSRQEPTYNSSGRDADWYENIGEIPGMYWVSERKRYDYDGTAVPEYYLSGTQFEIDGRTYRMAVGHQASPFNYLTTLGPSLGRATMGNGNLLFDMNEL